MAYTSLAAGLLVFAVVAAVRARGEVPNRRRYLTAFSSSCTAAAATYLFWMIAGPWMQESSTTLRYAIPALIGALSAAVPLWSALVSARMAAVLGVVIAAPAILLFAAPMRDRLSTIYSQKSALAYLHQWTTAQLTRSEQFQRSVLGNNDPLKMRTFQEMIPPGEPVLVWTETTFLLDYRRNKIIDMNVAGMGQTWAHIPIPRYILWQNRGYGIGTPQGYRYDIARFGRRSGNLEARAIDAFRWLQKIAGDSKILRNENGIILLETNGQTSGPPG